MLIEFDNDVNTGSGYLALAPEEGGPGVPPLRAADTDTLLHLLFFLTYTKEGRKLLADNEPWVKPEGQARTALQAFFGQRWPGIPQSVRNALIEAHFSAATYREAQKNNLTKDMAQAEARYSEQLRTVTGQLFADGHKHEFSMNW